MKFLWGESRVCEKPVNEEKAEFENLVLLSLYHRDVSTLKLSSSSKTRQKEMTFLKGALRVLLVHTHSFPLASRLLLFYSLFSQETASGN